MEKKIDEHLVGFGTLKDWEEYEEHIYLGGAMTEIRYSAYDDTPSKEECDKLCTTMSGDVISYTINKLL